MANDYPQVIDRSTLTGVFQADQFLTIGVEGEMLGDGDAVVGTPEVITSAEDATVAFGVGATLTTLVNFILARGVGYVTAVASKKAAPPLIADRKAAWVPLEDDPTIRIRLTDSVAQADLAALADSCEQVEGIQHKQFCFGGLASGSNKAAIEALGAAVASKRAVAVGPGVYDVNGNLLGGNFGAALAACMVAQNPDITDSLNGAVIPATGGIEREAVTGLPLFRLRSNAGAPIDDFQDLLDAGISPFQMDPAGSGLAAFTHLRTTYTVDDTYDALMTLLIKDEVFLQIRALLMNAKFLRSGDTAVNRSLAASMVNTWLNGHSDWVQPVALPDGTTGYGVTVTPSVDLKSFTVAFTGQVIRGTNVINIADSLIIPVS